MKITEIAFTCYPVTDMPRARHFYETVLGLTPSMVFGNETTGWVEYDIGAATLSIGSGASGWNPNAGGGCIGLEVEDLDQAVSQLTQHKVPMKERIQTPVCEMVVASDPDGNSIILHHRKTNPCCQGEACCQNSH